MRKAKHKPSARVVKTGKKAVKQTRKPWTGVRRRKTILGLRQAWARRKLQGFATSDDGDTLVQNGMRYMSYAKARYFVSSLNIPRSQDGWLTWWLRYQRPDALPLQPEHIYRKSWVSWEAFLG